MPKSGVSWEYAEFERLNPPELTFSCMWRGLHPPLAGGSRTEASLHRYLALPQKQWFGNHRQSIMSEDTVHVSKDK